MQNFTKKNLLTFRGFFSMQTKRRT